MAFTIPYAFAFWVALAAVAVPEFALTLRSKRRHATAAETDRKSLPLMVAGLGVANIAALPLALVKAGQFSPRVQPALFCIGLALLIAGSLLRWHCRRMLGPYFTSAVAAVPGQPVIERGAYGWVRHPSYSAGLLVHAGYGLALGSWMSLLVIAAACATVYSYRISVEEQLLTLMLGDAYRGYMARRRRLVPYLY